MIPKIIHLMWLDKNIEDNQSAPKKYDRFINSFKEHNSDFQFMFWNMKKVRKLFKEYAEIRKYQQIWEQLSEHIQKCDMARFIIIYIYGGIYIDLDFICFKNLSPLLNRELLLTMEPIEHSEYHHDDIERRLYNGFIGSVPKHSFWIEWLEYICDSIKKHNGDVMATTGPVNFRKFWDQSKFKHIALTNTCDIIPLTNNNGVNYITRDCGGGGPISDNSYQKKLGNYAHTRWVEGSGWGKEVLEEYGENKGTKQNTVIIVIVIITIIILIFITLIILNRISIIKN